MMTYVTTSSKALVSSLLLTMAGYCGGKTVTQARQKNFTRIVWVVRFG
jgi:hypothetical protein